MAGSGAPGGHGYGLRPVHALEKDAKSNGYPGADGQPKGNPNDSTPITFEAEPSIGQDW